MSQPLIYQCVSLGQSPLVRLSCATITNIFFSHPLGKHVNDLFQRTQKFEQRVGTRLRFIDVNLMPAPVDHGNLGTWDRVAHLYLLV